MEMVARLGWVKARTMMKMAASHSGTLKKKTTIVLSVVEKKAGGQLRFTFENHAYGPHRLP
jgi:hypothetical protein